MEAAVRWSPRAAESQERFLVVGIAEQSVTLHQVNERHRAHVRSHVVARYVAGPNAGGGINAYDWSKVDESLIVLGFKTGVASFVKLREGSATSDVISQCKPKQERRCNAIAISMQNWLAVGFDKIRADPACLNIYDGNVAGATGQSYHEPRKLCMNEPVSSVKFIPSQPQTLLAAAQRSLIRIYDLRDGSTANNTAVQVATRNVNEIAIDQLDENYFASAGPTGEPHVTVWDRRWIVQGTSQAGANGAVFDLKPAFETFGASVRSLRYSGQQRGRLGILSSTGELKVLDMTDGQQTQLQSSQYLPINAYGGNSWSCNRYVSQNRTIQHSHKVTRDNLGAQPKLIAFDWVSSSAARSEQAIIALRSNGIVDMLQVPRMIFRSEITARNDFSTAADDMSLAETKAGSEDAKPQAPYEWNANAEDFGPRSYSGEEDPLSFENRARKCVRGSPHITRLLAPSVLQRERCRRGYLWDPHRNMDIVAGNWQLERLWEIINRFQAQGANSGMVAESIDLSFVGVCGIWSEDVALGPHRTLSNDPTTVNDAIVALNASRELSPFEGERTNFPEHRQLCLALCGWQFTPDTLEAECQELIDRGLYYQAIVQAVLHGYKHIALNFLRTLIRGKTLPNIGLNALLASDSINSEQREMCLWMAADTNDSALKALLTYLSSDDWRDVMKTNYLHLGYRVALGLKYLNDTELNGFIQSETARAVKNGDLEGILLTGLGDQAMDLMQTYIAKTNDLQTAVLATAFTNPRYNGDGGTGRWEMWKETYFEQMQSWRMFTQRVRFVTEHRRLSRARDGRCLIEQPSPQMLLRCNHCQSTLARQDLTSSVTAGEQQKPLLFGEIPSMKGSAAAYGGADPRVVIGPAASAGITCPKCGRHLPRCGICRMWLGTADPRRSAKQRENSETLTQHQYDFEGKTKSLDGVMATFLTFCLRCHHGFHAHHAQGWFAQHSICPVPHCRCRCITS